MNQSTRLPKTDLVYQGSWKHLLYHILHGSELLIYVKKHDNDATDTYSTITYYFPSTHAKFEVTSDLPRLPTLDYLAKRYLKIKLFTKNKKSKRLQRKKDINA